MVTRENYEIWFIDAADGKLSSDQVEQLEVFLMDNPDLLEEFEQFRNVKLSDPDPQWMDKSGLLKEEHSGFITHENFEHYCIAYMEGDLSQKEMAELNIFLDANPLYRDVLRSFKQTKLTPPEDLSFGNLKKLEKHPRRRAYRVALYSSMAAAAALLMFILLPAQESEVPGVASSFVQKPKEAIKVEEPRSDSEDIRNLASNANQGTQETTAPQEASSSPDQGTTGVALHQPVKTERVETLNRTSVDISPLTRKEATLVTTQLSPLPVSMALYTPDSNAVTPIDESWASAPQKDHILEVAADKVDQVTPFTVDFDHEKDEEKVAYTFRVGRFGFSRTRARD